MDIKRSDHRPLPRFSILIVMLLLPLLSSSAQANAFERLFAPKAERWDFWDARDPGNTTQIDHSSWNTFLGTYVLPGEDGINLVRYASVSDADRQQLKLYIAALEQLPIRQYSSEQQLAYWINLYNALTIDVVLQHYPVDSIRDIDISPGFLADGPWKKKLLTIEGEPLSLNDIEHRILRPVWQDPRLHYALNCASIGCPNLSNSAYQAATIDTRLDQAATSYINHPRGVSFDNGKLTVSSIYSWFRDDFGESDAAVIAHLQRYALEPLQDALADSEKISGYRYDWSLNDAP
jgi:hypothetical protein